jgi:hypothetical protein
MFATGQRLMPDSCLWMRLEASKKRFQFQWWQLGHKKREFGEYHANSDLWNFSSIGNPG